MKQHSTSGGTACMGARQARFLLVSLGFWPSHLPWLDCFFLLGKWGLEIGYFLRSLLVLKPCETINPSSKRPRASWEAGVCRVHVHSQQWVWFPTASWKDHRKEGETHVYHVSSMSVAKNWATHIFWTLHCVSSLQPPSFVVFWLLLYLIASWVNWGRVWPIKWSKFTW